MLERLFQQLAGVLDGERSIETMARNALLAASDFPVLEDSAELLADPFMRVMSAADADPVCDLIAKIPFHWKPPETSSDPSYVQHSLSKVWYGDISTDNYVYSGLPDC